MPNAGVFLAFLLSVTPPLASGIAGRVVLWPTCPVERAGHPCERPVEATIDVLSTAGRVIGKACSDASGKFRIALKPGTYVLEPERLHADSMMPRPVSQTVIVKHDAFTQVRVIFDTGIR